MTPSTQLHRHDPDNFVLGDCFRTAIAMLLDLPPEDVPHFYGCVSETDAEVVSRMREWLRERQLALVELAFGECEMDVLMGMMKRVNPGVYYLLSGQSPRGTHHVVVCLDDKIIADPHPDGGDLVGPTDGTWWITLLASQHHLAEAKGAAE